MIDEFSMLKCPKKLAKVKYVMELYLKMNTTGSTNYVQSLMLFSQSAQNHHLCAMPL